MNQKFNYLEIDAAIFELAQVSQDTHENATSNDEKRELLNILFSNVKVLDGKLLSEWQNGLHLVAERAKNDVGWGGGIRTPE